MKLEKSIVVLLLLALMVSACASYYQDNHNFNRVIERGDIDNAISILTTRERDGKSEGRNRFLSYVNNGLLLSISGKYEESNAYFEKAYLFGEDYHLNYLNEVASYFTNPMVTVYRGEDHEHLMLLYYKAINYLKMNRPEEALVECRRLDLRLKKLSDKYSSEKKFQRDAFVHVLMGITYQSTKDYNNAFIAYRNAVEIYEEDYASMFGISIPQQLKIDLLNTASWTGFTDEFRFYQEKFQMLDYQPAVPDAELVFFWHNGLSPVKSEWGVNFVIQHDGPDMVVFRNNDLNLSFPFELDEEQDENEDDKDPLAGLEFFRVAFPKYEERPSYYSSAVIEIDSVSYSLEQAESVSQIAFYSLQQRMHIEMAKGLLRAAMKKATEHSLKKENDALGALLGIVNAITEKADTRNWQTLPHSIYYTRVPFAEGENRIKFTLKSSAGDQADYQFTYGVAKGQTLFHTFSSLETMLAPPRLTNVTE